MTPVLLATLFLAPVLGDGETLRLASDDPDVTWSVDGVPLGRGPLQLTGLDEGVRVVWVNGPGDRAWQAIARPLDYEGGSMQTGLAWSAEHHGPGEDGPETEAQGSPAPWVAAGSAALIGVWAWTKRP